MAWIELTSSSTKRNLFVNAEHIYAIRRQSRGMYQTEPEERARLLFLTTQGSKDGAHSPTSIDVEQTLEQVMQMLQRAGAEITTIAED